MATVVGAVSPVAPTLTKADDPSTCTGAVVDVVDVVASKNQNISPTGPGNDPAAVLVKFFAENDCDNGTKEGTLAVRQDCSAEAHALFARAERSISEGLTKCIDWMAARDLFFESGALFATSGYPDEAANAFLHASIIMRSFNDNHEMSNALLLAAENVQVLRPQLSVDILDKLVAMLLKAGLSIQAARCRRDAAVLLEKRLDNPSKAIEMYREAMGLFGTRPMTKSLTKSCMERICVVTVGLKEYTAASKFFMEESTFVTRGLPKTKQYLYSLLCMLAEGYGSDDRYFDSLYFTRKRFDELQEEEKDFQKGKENKLTRCILDANDHGSLNEFDIAVFDYKSCSSFKPDEVFEPLVGRCRDNLYEHMEQYM